MSEYADPANPKSKAGLLSTVSGVHLQGQGTRLRNRRKQRRGRFGIGGGQSLRDRRRSKKSMRPMERLVRQDALYLMVVDMPSQQELDAVRQAIENLANLMVSSNFLKSEAELHRCKYRTYYGSAFSSAMQKCGRS